MKGPHKAEFGCIETISVGILHIVLGTWIECLGDLSGMPNGSAPMVQTSDVEVA